MPMSRWLITWNPKTYSGPIVNWKVSRYLDELRTGDDVVLWQSGAMAGVAGVYRVTACPVETPDGDPDKGWASPGDARRVEHILPLAEVLRLPDPIPKAVLRKDRRFADAMVLRAPFQANPFRLTEEQWAAVRERLLSADVLSRH